MMPDSFDRFSDRFLGSLRIVGLNIWQEPSPKIKLSLYGLFCSVLWITGLTIGLAGLTDVYLKVMHSPRSPEDNTKLTLLAAMTFGYLIFPLLALAGFIVASRKLHNVIADMRLYFADSPLSSEVYKNLSKTLLLYLISMVVSVVLWLFLRTQDFFEFASIIDVLGWRISTVTAIVVFQTIPFTCSLVIIGPLTLFYAFMALIIGLGFQAITSNLLDSHRHFESGTISIHQYTLSLEASRARHLQLSTIVRNFNAVFSPGMFLLICCHTAEAVLMIGYVMEGRTNIPLGFFVTSTYKGFISSVISAVGNGGFLFMSLGAACFLKIKAHGIAPVFHILLEKLCSSGNVRKQVSATLQRLNENPVALTGWNIVNMDVNFVVTIAGVLATYLLVVHEMTTRSADPKGSLNMTHPDGISTLGSYSYNICCCLG